MHFTFCGVDSRDFGIYMISPLSVVASEEEIEFIDVPGRAGSLTVRRGGYKDIETEIECYIDDIERIGDAYKFLRGSGKLIESTNPSRSYQAVFYGEPEAERQTRGMKAWILHVPVRLKPFRYFEPAPAEITIIASGASINNPGTQASAPRIAISGSGDVEMLIGMYAVELTGLSDGVVIDSDLQDIFAADGITRPENDEMVYMDKYPLLDAGLNTISWSGEGSISEVKILPRWRDR